MKFNEDTRVKIPTIIHLGRLGYEYISLKNNTWNTSSNIFTKIFKESILSINPSIKARDTNRILEDIHLSLENEDLGKAFYEKLIDQSGIKLIDFAHFENNRFNVVTELPCKNDDEEFRPDITLLINGIPLCFIEVKKPNNREGVIAEQKRINTRSQNRKFRRFINITQVMVFSNNMEYDNDGHLPIQGAFYASPSYSEAIFNYFREEGQNLLNQLNPVDENAENFILQDNNLQSIKHSQEFITNKGEKTPTNRMVTSLFSKDRIAFFLKYAIAYVNETKGLKKHIMRYQQFFATQAIGRKLDEGVKKGIVWHTQGSGKTALAFYNVKYLTDYFQKKNIIPKFYFIVDRLDLLTQAHREFTSRGLRVHTVSSKEDFLKDLKKITAFHNASGNLEITVVNIQKFKDEADITKKEDYDINIQRVYFLDEVHRSYNPKGSFLANLTRSDTNAIKIGLTGTPLLGNDYSSKLLFGGYIHKYYYNASIADGYTLRLIREGIETNYKMSLQKAVEELELTTGDIDKKTIYSHKRFVEPMLKYIIEDFEKSRTTMNDSSIGGMIICDSSGQARKMYELFQEKYGSIKYLDNTQALLAKRRTPAYGIDTKEIIPTLQSALILHDAGTKEERKEKVEDFKEGKIDILIVYNMLLTGFDANRLKKIYLGRVIKKHNLLQALTRVNRPYNDFRYGYVVDFADIRKEFDATNKAYFDELQSELGDEMEHYSNLFKSKEEIEEEIAQIKDLLFHYDTKNAENFSFQISRIQDKSKMQAITKILEKAKSLYNLIRIFGHYGLLEKLDYQKLNRLYTEARNRLDMLNLKEKVEKKGDISNVLNQVLEEIFFMFKKVSEKELILADKLKNTLRKTREALANNFDKDDPKFTTLKEELQRLFKKKNLREISQEEMNNNIDILNDIHEKIKELNRENDLLKDKYQKDQKYARTHKRIMESNILTKENNMFEALHSIKTDADDQILKNSNLLNNEGYFNTMMTRLIASQFKAKQETGLNLKEIKTINTLLVKEYLSEYKGAYL